MEKKKYVFISNMASPYQVKFCQALQKYFEAEFWFYENLDDTRPSWWKIPLEDKCKVMKYSFKIPKFGYISFGLFCDLIRFKPDIIVLGGFMKWHWVVLKLAKIFKVKVAIMSEPLRFVNHDDEQSTSLMTKENSKKKIKLLKKMFETADLYLGMGDAAVKQFIEEFEFPIEKVDRGKYPQDIEEYYKHAVRTKKVGDHHKLLFANRLVERYNPLFMLEVFKELLIKYPNLELYMNNDGPLKQNCLTFIKENNLKNVKFLDKIDSWNNMHKIYEETDILVLPASYSNGNGSVTEARASGMGIVISNGIKNLERHSIEGENCFICNLNVNDFVNSIEKYLVDNELLLSHGKLSREMIRFKTNKRISEDYYKLFHKHGFIN